LLGPIGADLFTPTDKTAFERTGPSDVDGHKGEGRPTSRALKAA
jgi:hypothetical protein